LYFGEELILIKSPVNGALLLRPLTKDEFVPLRTFSFHQNILDSHSLITLVHEYLVAGDSQGGILIINMKNSGKEPTRMQLISKSHSVNEVQAWMLNEG
jgi:hypothetical protein